MWIEDIFLSIKCQSHTVQRFVLEPGDNHLKHTCSYLLHVFLKLLSLCQTRCYLQLVIVNSAENTFSIWLNSRTLLSAFTRQNRGGVSGASISGDCQNLSG